MFLHIPILCFSHLVNLFNNQLFCIKTFERISSDLYQVVQDLKESLRYFVSRFDKELLNIPNIDMAIVVEVFKMIQNKYSLFYEDFVMTPCRRTYESISRALRFTKLEEDNEI